MYAEMAFAGCAHRQVLAGARPFTAVLEARHGLVLLDRGRAVAVECALVHGAGVVGAGCHAFSAADALLVVDHHQPGPQTGGLLPGGAVSALDRAGFHAGRVVALQTRPGQEGAAHLGVCALFVFVHRSIKHARRQLVLRHAAHGAGMAAHAFAQVDEHGPAALRVRSRKRPLQVLLHDNKNILVLHSFHLLGDGGLLLVAALAPFLDAERCLAVVAGAA